ncbi:thiamine pyrophosphate-binding protein [Clostridium gasigenes]|uniref:Acetolactate synthase-1/2/3 large subunit n=1 Tax=Clostridium gasigenes TaxID=94869 RepID=A0A1H0LA25_9CLOT|nr:thiamine pyrophosphate-binding protein [Clostridium gasigenes]SDO64916.1 acetolactate synthase-1/2/3 large subunit [Clostridium gasigenes]
MKVSDYIVEFIKEFNIDTIFGYQGGAITHLVDSIYKAEGISFVSLYNEQGAAFSAEAYSRTSENIGVCIATSGPGATNLITGIGSCFFDSIPCVFITGQVNTYEFRRRDNIRQEGFQETDIIKIVNSITKYSVMVTKAEDIKYHLEKAFFLAKNQRSGPVLIDVPMNIQRADIDIYKLKGFYDSDEYIKLIENVNDEESLNEETLNEVIELLNLSTRPVILAGGGIRLSKSINELKELIDITGIPTVTTLMGLDSVDNENKKFVGYMGTYGLRYSNLAVANCDLLIVLGSRLTSRQTSPSPKMFSREAKIIHVDIDSNELNLKVKEDISIKCDLKTFIKKLIDKIKIKELKLNFSSWMDKIDSYKDQYPTYPTQKEKGKLDPNEVMYLINKLCNKNTIFCLDVGQNQIWAAQSMVIKNKQRVLTGGGMAAMGFALPAAIGAWYCRKNSKIVAIVGDGGFQMNIQELQAVVRDKIPVKIILMNNHSLGMIRHFQELYFNSNYYGTIDGYSAPDFIKVCSAYGIDSHRINSINQINNIEKLINDDKSHFIEIDLSNITYVIPKLEMGNPIEDQSPLVDRNEFYKNMIIEPFEKTKN